MQTTPNHERPTWEETPGLVRDQIEGGIGFLEEMVRSYTECVTDKEIANRRFRPEDPEAWAKTVRTLVSQAFLLGHMVGGASTLGYPDADKLFNRWAKVVK